MQMFYCDMQKELCHSLTFDTIQIFSFSNYDLLTNIFCIYFILDEVLEDVKLQVWWNGLPLNTVSIKQPFARNIKTFCSF